MLATEFNLWYNLAMNKAIVTVIGKDRTGIIAAVATKLSEWNANIEDISQTIMEENFVMVMSVDFDNASIPFDKANSMLTDALSPMGVQVRVQHIDIFNSMHRV